jgi:hypothetical protein
LFGFFKPKTKYKDGDVKTGFSYQSKTFTYSAVTVNTSSDSLFAVSVLQLFAPSFGKIWPSSAIIFISKHK